ncbi:MAG: polysaccharide biosynthesis/export family protein [Gammaproteobacteria bacterium]
MANPLSRSAVSVLRLYLLFLLALTVPCHASDDHYRLGKGDELRITVFGETDLSGTFVLDGKGYIAMPLIGEVLLGNLNLRQAEGRIVTKLKDGFLKQPRVSVEVLNFRPFYILGEVKTPGSYPFVEGMSVLEAVAVAGGFTYRAKKSDIEVKRGEDDRKQVLKLPIDARVQPGDIIRVEERFF